MIKYELIDSGIKDRETGACIPMVDGNRHYREYLEWLAEGNTPIPVKPSPYHSLDVNEQWVEDVAEREHQEALQFLTESDRDMARVAEDLVEFVVNGTPLPAVAVNMLQERKTARTKLKTKGTT